LIDRYKIIVNSIPGSGNGEHIIPFLEENLRKIGGSILTCSGRLLLKGLLLLKDMNAGNGRR